ncbi:hypothetical protein V6N13_135160 [Hibiscus sabdariffa]
MARRRALKVSALKILSNEWCTEHSLIKGATIRFFQDLFTSALSSYEPYGTTGLFPPVDLRALGGVALPITNKEINDVVPLVHFVPQDVVHSLGFPLVADMVSSQVELSGSMIEQSQRLVELSLTTVVGDQRCTPRAPTGTCKMAKGHLHQRLDGRFACKIHGPKTWAKDKCVR